jgi:hypothetical protein
LALVEIMKVILIDIAIGSAGKDQTLPAGSNRFCDFLLDCRFLCPGEFEGLEKGI